MGVLRYFFSPELSLPSRAVRGSSQLARTVAGILVSGRVLPRGASILQKRDLRVSEVLAAGFDHCPADWKHADRIALLLAVCLSLVLAALLGLSALLTALIPAAQAAEAAGGKFMPDLLSSVFGAPDVFGGSSAFASSPIHGAFQAMLAFYSKSMMVVATFIVMYFVVVVVGESAQSGTPFGRRFNGLWAPLRLVFALGLLVPLGAGLNAAQYVTLYAAKHGSKYATEAWRIFKDGVEMRTEEASPSVPAFGGLVRSIFLSEVCSASFNVMQPNQMQMYHETAPTVGLAARIEFAGKTFAPVSGKSGADLEAAAKDTNSSVVLIWGKPSAFGSKAGIERICGSISVKAGGSPIVTWYSGEVLRLAETLRPLAQLVASVYVPTGANWNNATVLDDAPVKLAAIAAESQKRGEAAIKAGYQKKMGEGAQNLDHLGWVEAGVYYPSLAKSTRIYMNLVRDAFPVVTVPVTASQFDNKDATTGGAEYATVMSVISFAERMAPPANMGSSGILSPAPEKAELSVFDRPLEAILNMVFGTSRLREMRANPALEPMSMLTAAGSDLVTRSMYVFGLGLAAEVGSSFLTGDGVPKWISGAAKAAQAVGGFAVSIALVGLLAGIVLLYVLPLLPFVYFFFSLLGWIFSLAEALIAMPLWALAHLRIDGDDFAGPQAGAGYWLLFELFLRPLLIVLAAVVSYLCFWGGTWALSSLFDLATAEVAVGAMDKAADQSGLDAFVFTIFFAVMAYGIATAAFKLIDRIPNEILRWAGANARPFNGGNDSPDLRSVVLGGAAVVNPVTSAFTGLADKAKRSPAPTTPTGLDGVRQSTQRALDGNKQEGGA